MAKKIVNKQLKIEKMQLWPLNCSFGLPMLSQKYVYIFQTTDLDVGHPVNAWIHKGELVNCLKLEFPLDGRIFMADWSVDLQSFQRAS